MIEDGKGTGKNAEVDSENHLVVNAVSQSVEHWVNHVKGTAWNILFAATPTGAGDCFFYLKNTGDEDIVVEGMWLKVAADEYFDVNINDTGTPIGGTAITPVNLNSGSGTSPTITLQQGNDITGLTAGNTAVRLYHASSTGSTNYNFDQDIILKKNGVLTLYCQTGTTALAGMLVINEHSKA